MDEHVTDSSTEVGPLRFYHGTRADLHPGDTVQPRRRQVVYFTHSLDAATWAAELDTGDGPGRVYIVEPTGEIHNASDPTATATPAHLSMTWHSRQPLRVVGEVSEWPLYHGTRADLAPGDLIKPGHTANFGSGPRTANHVYLTRTTDAATWGAELAAGEGPGRIHIVEPTGPIEDDPNLTDRKFRGNPTKSFRSKSPLRVIGEVTDWRGHPAAAVQAMKEGLERLRNLGVEPVDD